MILITDTTGFIGRATVRELTEMRNDVRCLLRPARHEQRLPKGTAVSIVSAAMDDLPALRTSLQDVTAVLHLMGEDGPDHERLKYRHAEDTANLLQAAQEVGVRRFVYLSRLGAERTSAYPLFQARGEAEVLVRESGLDYTILQPAITYGQEDAFTNVLAMLGQSFPFVVPIPDAGRARFQPLWVGDLVRCLADTIARDDLIGQTITLGGPEHFTLDQMMQQIMTKAGIQKRIVRMSPPVAHFVTEMSNGLLPRSPIPYRWLDVLAMGSATDLTNVSRTFGFEPHRFTDQLNYLQHDRHWRWELLRFVIGRSDR